MDSNEITGRDSYITTQSLFYAIAQIQALPEEMQEFSNMCDMCQIARTVSRDMRIQFVMGVEHHTGRPLDLYPHTREEILPYCEDEKLFREEKAEAVAFRAEVDAMREYLQKAIVEAA